MDNNWLIKTARIVKRKDGYHVLSEEGKNLGGPYKSRDQAEKRLRQVEFFKHQAGPKDWVLPLALMPGVVNPPSTVPAETPGVEQLATGWQHYDHLIGPAASSAGIPADMFERLLKTENTTGNPRAKSDHGALGLAQLLPGTAAELGVDPLDPTQAIPAAAKYLKALHNEFGNWEDAIAAYNWGAGNMHQWLAKEEPGELPQETTDYIRKIQPPESSLKSEASGGNILVGTSGFKYKHWAGAFYPQDVHGRDWLRYYATRFPTVEISSTFHHMPEPRVLKTWHDSTPDDFVFAIRAPKAVTHEAHLEGCGPLMSTFMRRVEMLGDKLGPVTFQLQSSQPFDAGLLERFAGSLPSGFRYSIEFRSEPWYNEAAYEILSDYNIACVVVGHSYMGIHTRSTADWSHIRMSGHHPDYTQNSYSDDQLRNWRGIIADASKPSYVYFNNEYKAYAATNALRMMEIVGLKYPSKPMADPKPRAISPDLSAPVPTDDGYTDNGMGAKQRGPRNVGDPGSGKDYSEQYPAQDW